VELFCFCATQWQRSETGIRLGLNYPAVQAVFTMHHIPLRRQARLLADIRLIELGALSEMAEQAEKS